jgi:hypothetical protein
VGSSYPVLNTVQIMPASASFSIPPFLNCSSCSSHLSSGASHVLAAGFHLLSGQWNVSGSESTSTCHESFLHFKHFGSSHRTQFETARAGIPSSTVDCSLSTVDPDKSFVGVTLLLSVELERTFLERAAAIFRMLESSPVTKRSKTGEPTG